MAARVLCQCACKRSFTTHAYSGVAHPCRGHQYHNAISVAFDVHDMLSQVAQVVHEMVVMGQADAAADLAADLADRALSVACDIIIQLANQAISTS